MCKVCVLMGKMTQEDLTAYEDKLKHSAKIGKEAMDNFTTCLEKMELDENAVLEILLFGLVKQLVKMNEAPFKYTRYIQDRYDDYLTFEIERLRKIAEPEIHKERMDKMKEALKEFHGDKDDLLGNIDFEGMTKQ